MTSTGPTVIVHSFIQERVVRNSASGNSWSVEYGQVTLNGSGEGSIETDMDKVKMFFGSQKGTAAATKPIVANIDNPTQDATTKRYSITVFGDANAVVFYQILGYFVGE